MCFMVYNTEIIIRSSIQKQDQTEKKMRSKSIIKFDNLTKMQYPESNIYKHCLANVSPPGSGFSIAFIRRTPVVRQAREYG